MGVPLRTCSVECGEPPQVRGRSNQVYGRFLRDAGTCRRETGGRSALRRGDVAREPVCGRSRKQVSDDVT
jgi:hypothetical protein